MSGHFRPLRSVGAIRQYNVHPLVSCIRQSVDEKFKPRDDTRSTPAPDFNVVAATLGTPCGLDELNQTLEWAPTVVPTLKSGVWGCTWKPARACMGFDFFVHLPSGMVSPKASGCGWEDWHLARRQLSSNLNRIVQPTSARGEALPQLPLQPQRWRLTMSMLASRR